MAAYWNEVANRVVTYLVVMSALVLAAFKAAWDTYSPDVFAMICVLFAVGAWAAVRAFALAAEARKTKHPVDQGGYGCAFWIAWKLGGVAVILLLGAAFAQWF